jgi:Bacterial PH domain
VGLMGFFDGMMGNASEVNPAEAQREFARILAREERIEKAYKLIRDLFIFTNKRLILVDKQGLTGKKVEYHSIPYKSITHFSIETAGSFDLDAELKIWISGNALPLQKQFNKNLNIYELQTVLAEYVLK